MLLSGRSKNRTGSKPQDNYMFFTFPDTLIANQPIEGNIRSIPARISD
jgi:hypothetical protein